MLPVSTFRQAAVISTRRTAIAMSMPRAVANPIAFHLRRTYATNDNNDSSKDAEGVKKAEEEVKQEQQQNTEATAGTTEELSEEVKKMLAEKDKQIAEMKNAYIRCLADQENLRERSRKELETTKEYAIQKFAKDLLDTVDILNMALTAVPKELLNEKNCGTSSSSSSEIVKDAEKLLDQLNNLYTGVSMTEAELIKALKRHGVERDNPDGQTFDPNKHQALFQAPMADKEPGTIFAVQKMGYTLKGRVLRPAQVGVVAESQ
ncbi:GrpE-domain-containing protein [Mycotypha africana]|uniref:GrpE-domain-containing protein n=1 Tax=Mycotypha africana TaxID=64632 RepID=UPI002301A9F7|nr:GrpE-domain-containing protein [Mycotypha africana]KAI8979209.1 GrpE-domain-containing protein [Mycotypha africana]